jgi:hypothetical protein
MSQSDYIKYKKVTTVLAVDNNSTNNKLKPVLNSQEYSNYKEYVLENTVTNNKTVYRRIVPTTVQVVLDMEKNKSVVQNMGTSLSNCPSFLLCNSTNLRKNRLQLLGSHFTPTPQPLNWQQTKNASWKKTGCKCILNSVHTNENICKCKLSV